jgi:hypothetical protein
VGQHLVHVLVVIEIHLQVLHATLFFVNAVSRAGGVRIQAQKAPRQMSAVV